MCSASCAGASITTVGAPNTREAGANVPTNKKFLHEHAPVRKRDLHISAVGDVLDNVGLRKPFLQQQRAVNDKNRGVVCCQCPAQSVLVFFWCG